MFIIVASHQFATMTIFGTKIAKVSHPNSHVNSSKIIRKVQAGSEVGEAK